MVTLSAIDRPKALDRVNHDALFSKLMKRFVENESFIIVERWISNCCSCVKWNDTWSYFFTLDFCTTGLGSLALSFRAILTQSFQSDVLQSIYIVLNADDILVMAPSVCEADQ